MHEWSPAKIEEGRTGRSHDLRVEEFMTTDLFHGSCPGADRPGRQPYGLETHPPRAGRGRSGPVGRRGFLVRGGASLCAPGYRRPERVGRGRRSRCMVNSTPKRPCSTQSEDRRPESGIPSAWRCGRCSGGLSLLAAYTHAVAIDDTSGISVQGYDTLFPQERLLHPV